MGSQQVDWWSVREYVAPILEAAGPLPMAGTPQWCALDDDDPRKVAALFDAAQHWTLRVECFEQFGPETSCDECRRRHLAEASRDISAAAAWSAIATEIYQRRNSGYIPREFAS